MPIVLLSSRPEHEWMAKQIDDCQLITSKDEFTQKKLDSIQPQWVFIPHWSYIIPANIYENFNCVIFHMTDLPYGRGGSPLQNLIVNGHSDTKISALRCSEGLDTGPIYLKKPLGLEGSASEIFERASKVIFEMIQEILKTNPEPIPQEGEPTMFTRRKPEQSSLDDISELSKIYDMIRMLDADGYPHAFLETKDFRFEFRKAETDGEEVKAHVCIRPKQK